MSREQLKRELSDLIDEHSPFTYKDWVTNQFLFEIINLVNKNTPLPDKVALQYKMNVINNLLSLEGEVFDESVMKAVDEAFK